MVKYMVIDLSKLSEEKLSKFLTDAYNEGYNDAKREQYNRGYESSYTVANLNGLYVGDSITSCADTVTLSATDCSTISSIDTTIKSSN